MASHNTFLFLIFKIFIAYRVSCQNLDYKDVLSCKDGSFAQYFNPVTLSCADCSQNLTVQKHSSDGLSCECQPGYRYVMNFGGKKVTCAFCPIAVSDDGWECVSCSGTVNAVTKKCEQCTGDDKIRVLRLLNGDYSIPNNTVNCQTCSSDTQRNDGYSKCERCSTTLSIRGTSCQCGTNEVKKKGFCIPVADLPNQSQTPPSTFFRIPLDDKTNVESSAYLFDNVEADYYMCKTMLNSTACQSLANLCVLIMYNAVDVTTASSTLSDACGLYLSLAAADYTDLKPQITSQQSADLTIYNKYLDISWTVDPIMRFPFIIATYALDGTFEGFDTLDASFLQLCRAEEKILNAAFDFGTYYYYSCSFSALSLWNDIKYPLKFYELYLKYFDTTQNPQKEVLYKIPVKILDFRSSRNDFPNADGEARYWQLMYRFFLVDSVTTATKGSDGKSGSTCETTGAPYVRYIKSFHLYVELQPDQGDGKTYIPYFDIDYAYISRDSACKNSSVQFSFQVSYTMSQSNYNRNFQIATGVLSSFGLLYAGFRTYVWSRRAGRISIDFPTLANFIFYLCGSLANCFFCIVFGVAFYFFIFYKRQNVVFLVHLEGQPYDDWISLFASAFVLKALALLHMVIMQCSIDIFFIDWERPKGSAIQGGGEGGKKPLSNVSIWRTYFVANEWNEIQTKRKLNPVFQIFVVVFFLHVVGFEDTSTKDPDGTVNKSSDVYMSEQSTMFRMALAALIYLIVGIVQVVFFVLFYERFISDDIREFVDLCSMSNVSVFVMANGEFGYYVHGRSVHGCSDVGMDEMCDMIKREENDLVGQRGLVSGTEGQTFMMAIPKRLREKYMAVYMPVQLENATSRMGKSATGKEKSIEAYMTLNRFFCGFIDHSLRDIDYVVKDKNFLEKILDTEFLELTDKGIFYYDSGHSFDNVLFYGNELMLLIFDVLLFCIVDLIFSNFVLAGVITYIIIELIRVIRDTAGKKNLAKKTLVDERFLI